MPDVLRVVRVSGLGRALGFTWLVACGASPGPSEWVAIELAGRTVGVEEQRRSEGAIWRRRVTRLRVAGAVEERVTTSTATLGPLGDVVRYASDGRSWSAEGEPVYLLELSPHVRGEVLAFDTDAWSVERTTVTADGWTLGGLTWTRHGEALSVGPVTLRPVDAPPTLEDVDPVAILRRPAPDVGRRTTWARYRVHGEDRVVRPPLALEVPSAVRARFQAMFDGEGDCKAQAAAFVARATQDGLDARVVEGLVWMDDPPGLVPHAWVEVRLGAQVVPVDPALNQLVADATHLELQRSDVLSAEVVLVEAR